MAKYSGYVFLSSILLSGIAFVQSIIVARLLGPNDLGVMTTVFFMSGIFGSLAGFGMSTAVVRILPEEISKKDSRPSKIIGTYFWLILITSLPVYCIYFLISPFLTGGLYGDVSLTFFVRLWIVGAIVGTFVSFFRPLLQAYQKITLMAKIRLLFGGLGMTITVLLVFYLKLLGVFLSLIIISLFSLLIYIMIFRRELGFRLRDCLPFDKSIGKSLVHIGGPTLAIGIFFTIANWYVVTMLSFSGGFKDVGLFKVAFSVVPLILIIPSAIATPFFPIGVEAYTAGRENFKKFLFNTTKYSILIAFPVCLVLAFLAFYYVFYLYSMAYLDAVPVISVFAAYAFLRTYNAITNHIYLIEKRMKRYFLRNGTWFIGILLLSFILIPPYLSYGLALTFFIARAVIIFLDLFFFGEGYRDRELLKYTGVSVLLALVIIATGQLVSSIPSVFVVMFIAVFAAAYAFTVKRFILTEKDKLFLRELIGKLREKFTKWEK